MKKRYIPLHCYFAVHGLLFSSCEDTAKKTNQPEQSAQMQDQKVPAFDAQRAYSYVEKQLSFGPREQNTKAHDSAEAYLAGELAQYADTVYTQKFSQAVYGKNLNFANIIGSFNRQSNYRVLLIAHWDSRPRSDEDSLPQNKAKAVPGANDGASGVAVLMEMARAMKSQVPAIGIDIAFVDGEDYGYAHDADMFALGSQYFAKNLPVQRPRYVILLDLVGDREAVFRYEGNSYSVASSLVSKIWELGQDYGKGHFVQEMGGSVTDDHLPFIKEGIPAIDIIDLELVGNTSADPRRRYWHTQRDDISNISAETLEAVGTTLLQFLYKHGNNF